MKFTPLNDRVLVKPDDANAVSAGGIIIPDNAQGRADMGTIIAAGPGDRNTMTGERMPLAVKVGDRVAFGRYAGSEITLNGEKLFFMREEELFAIGEE